MSLGWSVNDVGIVALTCGPGQERRSDGWVVSQFE
jgi:hypothetical protein